MQKNMDPESEHGNRYRVGVGSGYVLPIEDTRNCTYELLSRTYQISRAYQISRIYKIRHTYEIYFSHVAAGRFGSNLSKTTRMSHNNRPK